MGQTITRLRSIKDRKTPIKKYTGLGNKDQLKGPCTGGLNHLFR